MDFFGVRSKQLPNYGMLKSVTNQSLVDIEIQAAMPPLTRKQPDQWVTILPIIPARTSWISPVGVFFPCDTVFRSVDAATQAQLMFFGSVGRNKSIVQESAEAHGVE